MHIFYNKLKEKKKIKKNGTDYDHHHREYRQQDTRVNHLFSGMAMPPISLTLWNYGFNYVYSMRNRCIAKYFISQRELHAYNIFQSVCLHVL